MSIEMDIGLFVGSDDSIIVFDLEMPVVTLLPLINLIMQYNGSDRYYRGFGSNSIV